MMATSFAVCREGNDSDAHVQGFQKRQLVGLVIVAKVEGLQGLFHGHQFEDMKRVFVSAFQRHKKVEQTPGLHLKMKEKSTSQNHPFSRGVHKPQL